MPIAKYSRSSLLTFSNYHTGRQFRTLTGHTITHRHLYKVCNIVQPNGNAINASDHHFGFEYYSELQGAICG